MAQKAMDPDRFQMRDLKRRIKHLEDQKSYMKADHVRLVGRVNQLTASLDALELDLWERTGGKR